MKTICHCEPPEVQWYFNNGKHAERIKRDSSSQQYVVGDWSWNRDHPKETEFIESKMQRAGVYE